MDRRQQISVCRDLEKVLWAWLTRQFGVPRLVGPIDRAQEAMGADPALGSAALGERLLAVAVTPPSNLLDWRTTERLKEIRSTHPGLLEEHCGDLARVGDQHPPPLAIDPFVKDIWPYFAEGKEDNLPYADIRDLVSLLLALAHPNKAIAVRYQRMHNAGVALSTDHCSRTSR